MRLVPDQVLDFQPNISLRGPQALWVERTRSVDA